MKIMSKHGMDSLRARFGKGGELEGCRHTRYVKLAKYCPNEGDDLPMLRTPIGCAVEAQNVDHGAVKPADLIIMAQFG